MLTLENTELQIELLDPVADAARQGTRYCWGGYIWQVHDRTIGPLVSGPEWPEPKPTAFNGQGLPESFRHRSRDGRPLTWRGREGIAIGIGALALDEAGNVVIAERCRWTHSVEDHRMVFQTRHSAAGFEYSLERTIELDGRTIRSNTRFTSLGAQPFELQWFAHPFFSLRAGKLQVGLRPGSTLPENPGFALIDDQLSFKRSFVGTEDGQFVLLKVPATELLCASLDHPTLQNVEFETSFAPDQCPIWGNGNTFSIEPYRILNVRPSEPIAWCVQYHFGERVLETRA
ncbi:hypothetical protein [Horticoccus sp. 23ND18S-11]|uniref:hypothetical protein n=1 Tax=Horticoccus sp. 23ND18S-11 TaxID=3391832 RepID=UPI0039C9184A